jgi:hypothetical protein
MWFALGQEWLLVGSGTGEELTLGRLLVYGLGIGEDLNNSTTVLESQNCKILHIYEHVCTQENLLAKRVCGKASAEMLIDWILCWKVESMK